MYIYVKDKIIVGSSVKVARKASVAACYNVRLA